MRDPEMVSRAHLAAVTLERAWERWRIRHGLSATPMPPVSSYVGYSLEEPWGRPRVVFGVDAAEAELLAAQLDRYDSVSAEERAQVGVQRPAPAPPAERPGEVADGAPHAAWGPIAGVPAVDPHQAALPLIDAPGTGQPGADATAEPVTSG